MLVFFSPLQLKTWGTTCPTWGRVGEISLSIWWGILTKKHRVTIEHLQALGCLIFIIAVFIRKQCDTFIDWNTGHWRSPKTCRFGRIKVRLVLPWPPVLTNHQLQHVTWAPRAQLPVSLNRKEYRCVCLNAFAGCEPDQLGDVLALLHLKTILSFTSTQRCEAGWWTFWGNMPAIRVEHRCSHWVTSKFQLT